MSHTKTRKTVRIVCFALASMIAMQIPAAASPGRFGNDRRDNHRVERQQDRRQDVREDRRDHIREEIREERREEIREDRRQDRRQDRRVDRWRYQRWNTWQDWLDFRRDVATARLVLGMIFAQLPPDHTTVIITGTTYYVHDDVYFIRVGNGASASYSVVAPPIGATVRVLPVGHTTVIVHGVDYHTYEKVYYLPQGDGYIVVARP